MNSLSNWAVHGIELVFDDIDENIFHLKQINDTSYLIYYHFIAEIQGYCTTMQINCLALKQMIDEIDRIKNGEDGLDNHG